MDHHAPRLLFTLVGASPELPDIAIASPLSTIFKFYISSLLCTIDSPTDDSALEDGQTISAAHGLMTSLQSHQFTVRIYVCTQTADTSVRWTIIDAHLELPRRNPYKAAMQSGPADHGDPGK